jgi:hypothetical protein
VAQCETISNALIGCDVAGSFVTMDVKRAARISQKVLYIVNLLSKCIGALTFKNLCQGTSNIEQVTLTRMANESIADRRALFEIFSTAKNRANHRDDKGDPQKSSI